MDSRAVQGIVKSRNKMYQTRIRHVQQEAFQRNWNSLVVISIFDCLFDCQFGLFWSIYITTRFFVMKIKLAVGLTWDQAQF